MSFKAVSFIFSPGDHFVQGNRTIFKSLVKGRPRYISVKVF